MAVASSLKQNSVAPLCKDNSGRKVVRWYLMSYPYGRKGLTLGLEQELKRRKSQGEPLFEYFAPTYIETREVDDKLVNTKTPLLYNYFFVRASEDELFRLKKNQPQYNVFRRITNPDGSYHYPYVKDSIIQTLRWIAKSYSGFIPLYLLDQTLLVKGDRIRIVKGPLKGVEARIVTRPKSAVKEIMVFVDNWMCVPLMNVRPSQYEVIDLNAGSGETNLSHSVDNPQLADKLHEALCRFHRGETTDEDRKLASDTLVRYSTLVVDTAIQRCKLYSLLLPACTILAETDKLNGLLKIIQVMLPKITAEQSLSLLMVTLYGCTDNFNYHERAHRLVDRWTKEVSPKKSKQLLIDRLADYDRCFGH